jgi:hypothetical protein
VVEEESFEDAEQESDQRTKEREPEREIPFESELATGRVRVAAATGPDWQFYFVFCFHRNVSVFLSKVPSPLLTRRAILP